MKAPSKKVMKYLPFLGHTQEGVNFPIVLVGNGELARKYR